MENVFFKPWIGPKYEKSNPKILVMGDSHYCGGEDEDGNFVPMNCSKCGVRGHSSYDDMKNDNSRNPDCPNFTSDDRSFTQGVIDCFIENLKSHSPAGFELNFLKFSNKLLGINKNDPEYYDNSIDFWNHLAFYNFVQTANGKTKSATEYKAKDRRMSSPLADEVVEALQPDYVMVWGVEAFKYWSPDEYIEKGDEEKRTGWITFTLKSGKIVNAVRIDHPSRVLKQKDFDLFSQILLNDYNATSLMDLWSNKSNVNED